MRESRERVEKDVSRSRGTKRGMINLEGEDRAGLVTARQRESESLREDDEGRGERICKYEKETVYLFPRFETSRLVSLFIECKVFCSSLKRFAF